jgi:hypothetical protein
MPTIWTFGDSYTAPFTPDPNLNDWRNNYCDWKGYVPKVYGDVISETLGMPLKNLGQGGIDNRTILDSIIDSLGTIKDDDIIIIGWSSILRFRLVNTSNKFQAVLPSIPRKIYKNLGFDVKPSTLEDILVNRSHVNYVKEHNKTIKMIRFLFKKNTVIQWSPFCMNNCGDGMKVENIILDIQNIRTETDGDVDDGHFSEKTQRDLAEKLLSILDKGGNISNKLI